MSVGCFQRGLAEEGRPECGCCHSMDWGPGLIEKGEKNPRKDTDHQDPISACRLWMNCD